MSPGLVGHRGGRPRPELAVDLHRFLRDLGQSVGKQVCAGHGFSTESVTSFRYRESIVATISGGTSQIQRNGIARSMGLRTY